MITSDELTIPAAKDEGHVMAFPTLEQFLAAPLEDVMAIAPETMIFSAGGSRRQAVLEGIPVPSKAYAHWLAEQTHRIIDVFFRHGVKNLFVPLILPNQMRETTPGYRDRLLDWAMNAFAAEETIGFYRKRGWRVRLLGAESIPEFAETAETLVAATPHDAERTLWWYVAAEPGLQWEWILSAAVDKGARTQQDAIAALYGEPITPATFFLSFGKPMASPDLLPPLLVGTMQCYWTQKPPYALTDDDFRRLLHDFAYLRRTWRQDKSGRAEAALAFRDVWQTAPIIGLGQRMGPFWYPHPG